MRRELTVDLQKDDGNNEIMIIIEDTCNENDGDDKSVHSNGSFDFDDVDFSP